MAVDSIFAQIDGEAMHATTRVLMALWGLLLCSQSAIAEPAQDTIAHPPPIRPRYFAGGFETKAPMEWPSITKIRDGRLLMVGAGQARYSNDAGKTWSAPNNLPVPIDYVRRLNSGKLGGPVGKTFYTSSDEGKSWQVGGAIYVSGIAAHPYDGAPLIQTKSGRLVLPVVFTSGTCHKGIQDRFGAWGALNGKLVAIEGHAHFPEPDIAFAYFSDDEGGRWEASEGGVMVWHKDGYGGMWPCDEPSLVEAKNSDLLMFCRTTLGRVYVARSGTIDYFSREEGKQIRRTPGQRFDPPEASVLASSYSPSVVRRIQKTGDLLIVWNQASGREIRGGYRRSRLSSAISRDDGRSWQHYRTIDAMVLPPSGRVEPDPEPQMARGLDYVGVLPDDYGRVEYPSLEIVDDTVFVFWYRRMIRERPGDVTGRRMAVLPLKWFYAEEPPSPPAPKLVVRIAGEEPKKWNSFEVPSQYHDGRFYCDSRDLAIHLKSPAQGPGRDIRAPLHQVVTFLGWVPTYDASRLYDKVTPQLSVSLRHAGVILGQTESN